MHAHLHSCCCLLTQQVNGCVMDELAALRQAERQANEIVHKAREGEQMHRLSRACFGLKQRHLPPTTTLQPTPDRKAKLRLASRRAQEEITEWKAQQEAELKATITVRSMQPPQPKQTAKDS